MEGTKLSVHSLNQSLNQQFEVQMEYLVNSFVGFFHLSLYYVDHQILLTGQLWWALAFDLLIAFQLSLNPQAYGGTEHGPAELLELFAELLSNFWFDVASKFGAGDVPGGRAGTVRAPFCAPGTPLCLLCRPFTSICNQCHG